MNKTDKIKKSRNLREAELAIAIGFHILENFEASLVGEEIEIWKKANCKNCLKYRNKKFSGVKE